MQRRWHVELENPWDKKECVGWASSTCICRNFCNCLISRKLNIFKIYSLCFSPTLFLFKFVFNPSLHNIEVSFDNPYIPWGRFAVVVASYVEGGVDGIVGQKKLSEGESLQSRWGKNLQKQQSLPSKGVGGGPDESYGEMKQDNWQPLTSNALVVPVQ